MNERDRIEYLMNLYGLTPSQFSDKTGIQRASVSHILSNRNKPSLEILLKIYHAFEGVELAWLVAGEGNPPVVNSENVDIQEAEAENVVDEPQKATNMLFSFMDEDVRLQQNATNKQAVETVATDKVVSSTVVSDVAGKATVAPEVCDYQSKRGVSLSIDADSDKRIKEIKVFYNNGTYETFLPEK